MSEDTSHLAAEMNRGFLQVLALLALEKSMYGYSMIKSFEKKGYEVEENTLYPLLRRLEKNGSIRSEWDVSEGRPKKFYIITPEGRTVRAELLRIWSEQNEILEELKKEMANV
ncbi:PadR family transcriptional regulator [Acidobacteriota bacterium]